MIQDNGNHSQQNSDVRISLQLCIDFVEYLHTIVLKSLHATLREYEKKHY